MDVLMGSSIVTLALFVVFVLLGVSRFNWGRANAGMTIRRSARWNFAGMFA